MKFFETTVTVDFTSETDISSAQAQINQAKKFCEAFRAAVQSTLSKAGYSYSKSEDQTAGSSDKYSNAAGKTFYFTCTSPAYYGETDTRCLKIETSSSLSLYGLLFRLSVTRIISFKVRIFYNDTDLLIYIGDESVLFGGAYKGVFYFETVDDNTGKSVSSSSNSSDSSSSSITVWNENSEIIGYIVRSTFMSAVSIAAEKKIILLPEFLSQTTGNTAFTALRIPELFVAAGHALTTDKSYLIDGQKYYSAYNNILIKIDD